MVQSAPRVEKLAWDSQERSRPSGLGEGPRHGKWWEGWFLAHRKSSPEASCHGRPASGLRVSRIGIPQPTSSGQSLAGQAALAALVSISEAFSPAARSVHMREDVC